MHIFNRNIAHERGIIYYSGKEGVIKHIQRKIKKVFEVRERFLFS